MKATGINGSPPGLGPAEGLVLNEVGPVKDTESIRYGSVPSRADRAGQFAWRLCAAIFLASQVLVTAQEASNAVSGGTTNVAMPAIPFSHFLSPYEPIYFLVGSYPAAEFQVSLKYQVFTPTNCSARATTNIYLAYTQTSFWDLLSSDPSFYDTSYKPSVFVAVPDILDGRKEKPWQLDLQSGLEHESNGRGGANERSLYTAYLQPTLTLGQPQSLQIAFSPRAWVYVLGLSENNPDMASYRGYADLLTTLSWKKQNQDYKLATAFGTGDDGNHSSLKVDFSFSLLQWTRWFTPRIHLHYFTGYGETLRQYNESSHGLRGGISLFD
jgi:outer membrane phospholipase A